MNKTGFGFLRLPKLCEEDEQSVDMDSLCAMVDMFMDCGGTYFDTAYTYLEGKSEQALREAVVERYPRDAFRIADKLPTWLLKSSRDCKTLFEEQLRRCGVSFFDVYLLHGLNRENYDICEKFNAFSFLTQLKAEGRAKKIGFSYHDEPKLLDEILTAHPEVDYVQLQINYLDWSSDSIRSGDCYEVAAKHGKRVIVMEPVKGGILAALPEKAEKSLRDIHPHDSAASWAIQFASGLRQVEIVLSGMSTPEQVEDNMRDYRSLSQEELRTLQDVAQEIRSNTAIACTACGYCMEVCPMHIPLPRIFSMYNDYVRHPQESWKIENMYDSLASRERTAGDCIGCKSCESRCPQKLKITEFLPKIAKIFNDLI